MSTEASVGEHQFFAQRGFGRRIGFGERPAVLVIDIINGFTDPVMPLGADLDTEIAAVRAILDAARARHVPVQFTTVQYEAAEAGTATVWHRKQAGLSTLVAGTPAVDVDPRLGRVPGEPVLSKRYASAFFATDLSSWLAARSVDTVILVGCTTSGCIRATAVDAIQHGLRPVVVEEAVGDRSAAAHAQALFDLDQKYADVVGVAEVLAYLAGTTAHASVPTTNDGE